jgi:hypothetical protein
MWLIASLSSWMPGFNPRPIYVGFVVYNLAVGEIFLQVLQFAFVFIKGDIHLSITDGLQL